MEEELRPFFSGAQPGEGGRAGGPAASEVPGAKQRHPILDGRAPAAADHVGVSEEGRSAAAATGTAWTFASGSSGGRAGITQGLPMTMVANQLVASQLDCDLTMTEAMHKQCRKTNVVVQYYLEENTRISQERREVDRVLEEFSLKNKEMTLEMERLRRVNEEVSLKNSELMLELENLKKNQVEREQTRYVHDGQVHEGSMTGNVPQEGWFDPVQLDRFIIEGHERQIKLTEIRKKLIEVFTNIGHCGPIIGIKRLGEINKKPFLDAGISKVNAAKKCTAWQKKIQGHIWRPYKRITEDGPSEEVLDEEDETLKELKACGQGIYDAVIDALKEMDKYNPSGRAIILELWNYKEGRKATVLEGIDCLVKKMMEYKNEKNCYKRRRSSRLR